MFRYGLFVCLTVVLTAVIGYATLATARLLRTWKPDRNLLLMPAENGIRLIILVALILLGILGEVPFSTLGWTLKNVRHEAVMGALWGGGIALFFFVATAWIYQKQVPGRFYSTVLIVAILPTSVGEGTRHRAAVVRTGRVLADVVAAPGQRVLVQAAKRSESGRRSP